MQDITIVIPQNSTGSQEDIKDFNSCHAVTSILLKINRQDPKQLNFLASHAIIANVSKTFIPCNSYKPPFSETTVHDFNVLQFRVE